MIGGGNLLKTLISFFVDSIKTVSISNHKVFESEVFTLSRRLTIPGSSTVNVVFDLTGATGAFVVNLPLRFKAYGGGPLEIDLYKDVVYTGGTGTVLPTVSRDEVVSPTAGTVVIEDPTITDPGVVTPLQYVLYSAAGLGVANDIAGLDSSELFFVNSLNVKRFEIRNTSAEDALFHIRVSFAETNGI